MPTPTWLTARTTESEQITTLLKIAAGCASEGEGACARLRRSRAAAISMPDSAASTSASVYWMGAAPRAAISADPNGTRSASPSKAA